MGTVCPQGHDSASSDFCDVCGTRISSSPPRPEGMTGKHHAPGRFVASGSESCPRCGSAVVGQFCEACGFRVSARRPFAPLGHQTERSSAAPAEAREMSPSGTAPFGTASSGPPESPFPPVSRPEPPFSAWSRPQPPPSPPSPPPPSPAPVGQAAGVPEAPESPDEPTVVVPFESVFPLRLPPGSPPLRPPPCRGPPPPAAARRPAEPRPGLAQRAAARAAAAQPRRHAHTLPFQGHLDRAGCLGSRLLQQDEGVARRVRLGRRVSGAHL